MYISSLFLIFFLSFIIIYYESYMYEELHRYWYQTEWTLSLQDNFEHVHF